MATATTSIDDSHQGPRPRSMGGFRKAMLADLRHWPASFRARLRKRIEFRTGAPHWARTAYERLQSARAWSNGSPEAAVPVVECMCGCRGANDAIGAAIRGLRVAIASYRGATTPRKRASLRQDVEWQKTNLLEVLWLFGRPRIDRRALAEHAMEDTAARLARSETELQWLLDASRYNRGRLAHGRYINNRGANLKGMPLSRRTRENFRAAAERAEEALPGVETESKRLRRLLEDRTACVRAFTGNRRAADVRHLIDLGIWPVWGADRVQGVAR